MSAEVLRRAAVGIRAQVERLSTDTAVWDEQFPAARIYADQSTYGRLMVHPAVALAVATLLETEATLLDNGLEGSPSGDALAVARVYLGEPS